MCRTVCGWAFVFVTSRRRQMGWKRRWEKRERVCVRREERKKHRGGERWQRERDKETETERRRQSVYVCV